MRRRHTNMNHGIIGILGNGNREHTLRLSMFFVDLSYVNISFMHKKKTFLQNNTRPHVGFKLQACAYHLLVVWVWVAQAAVTIVTRPSSPWPFIPASSGEYWSFHVATQQSVKLLECIFFFHLISPTDLVSVIFSHLHCVCLHLTVHMGAMLLEFSLVHSTVLSCLFDCLPHERITLIVITTVWNCR